MSAIETGRLRLRAPRREDSEHWAAFFASPRSHCERGPLARVEAYRVLAADVALWALWGYGAFGLADRTMGACLGEFVYRHPGPEAAH